MAFSVSSEYTDNIAAFTDVRCIDTGERGGGNCLLFIPKEQKLFALRDGNLLFLIGQ